MKNNKHNFGITLENLVCFKAVLPNNPNQNKEALGLIRDGIELFEIPKEGIGVPLDILEQANSVNVLALYLGLGRLIGKGNIPSKKQNISYDDIIKKSVHEAVSLIHNYGFDYNGIRKFQKRGFVGLEGKFAERIRDLPARVKKGFVESLQEARQIHYSQAPFYPNIELVNNLIGEVYASKHNQEFWVEIPYYKIRRVKMISKSKGREGSLYIIRQKAYPEGRNIYSCTCPSHIECRHIKEVKDSANQNS